MMKKKKEIIFVLLFTVLGLAAGSFGSVISVNFAGNDASGQADYNLATNQSAGFSAQFNWNNVRVANGSTVNIATPTAGVLVDHTGADSGVSIDWTSDGKGKVGRTGVSSQADNVLMNGFISANNNAAHEKVTVSFSNLTRFAADGYQVYVYFGSGTDNRSGTISDGSTTFYINTTSSASCGFPEDYTLAGITDTGFYSSANYAVFSGTADELILTYEKNAGSNNGGIHAIQIVANLPVPPGGLAP